MFKSGSAAALASLSGAVVCRPGGTTGGEWSNWELEEAGVGRGELTIKHGSLVGASEGRVVGPVICGAGIGARCVRKSSFVRGSQPTTGVAG